MKKKNIIGMVLIIGFGAMVLINFGSSVGGYMDFTEAERTNSDAHVAGTWVEEQSYTYDAQANVFYFHMADEKGNIRRVRYDNPKPANFEESERLVVQGRLVNGEFIATHILVKCPSKYNDEQGLKMEESVETAS
ncbi:MAG: cytochrome c maturation protein CcmE [Bacteroidota bacterium]